MKLGLITGEYPPLQGGVGDYTHELAQALTHLGIEVHVITRRGAHFPPPISHLSPPNLHVHPLIAHWSFPALFRIRAIAQSLNLSIINVQYQAAAYDLSAPIHFLPDVVGIPTVVTFHDLRIPYLFPKAGPLRPWAVTHLARAARGVIVTDPADEAELRRRGIDPPRPAGEGPGVRANRLTQIPIGSNITPNPPPGYDRAAWRAALGLAPDDFLMGYFGFLNESKGGDVLMGALAALRGRKANVKLILIGGQTGASDTANNAAFTAEIEKLINDYGVRDHIIQTGFVEPPTVSAHLLACEAVVLPYRDGASFRRGTLMAALAHGCATITTHPQQPLPLLRDGDNIRLVPPNSASAIVLAVTELLNAPTLRARLGIGARAVAQHFAWAGIAEKTLAFYRSIRE